MKNQAFRKLLKKNKSNSGFTLMELLVGLVMSSFVIGALGFGLMQMLNITKTETSKTAARNDAGRALDFISDELRRAQAIQVNTDTTTISSVASNFPFLTDGTVVLALQIPGVSERVIYSVAPLQEGQVWRGPLVIYRWGPTLKDDGSYSDTGAASVSTPGGWSNQALIDKVDETDQTINCRGTNVTYKGFYACVSDDADDDNDGVLENLTGGDDLGGIGITAKLYFTGGVETVSGAAADNYAADTKAVARARIAPGNKSDNFSSYTWSFEDLGGAYHGAGCNPASGWTMRTDFGSDSSNPDNTKKWIRDPSRQPQPITVDSTKPLTITSSPFGATGCNSRGNDYRWESGVETTTPTDGTEVLSKYDPNIQANHTIDFTDINSFNGNNKAGTHNESNVKGDQTVQFLKNDSAVPNYGAFDANNDGDYNDPDDQPSLGKFLFDKGLAILANDSPTTDTTLPNAKFVITSDLTKLGEDQRVVAFEVGRTDTNDPGFDLQDNIFIVTSDVFKKKFD